MKFRLFIIVLLLFAVILVLTAAKKKEGCSTAIITGAASADGVPMLWKNRDTGFLSNKVIYVEEKPYSYLGLVNNEETSGRWVYAGLNSEGFGIMNSVAYNLPKNETEMKDLEGLIMSEALRTCRTVDDFERSIKKNFGNSLGSWANFGVIDEDGHAVIFEVYNHGYKKYNAVDAPGKYLINTNFSRSGKEGKGAGYLRFERASALFKILAGKKVSHEFIFQQVSRDFGHPLLRHPTLKELENVSAAPPLWIYNRDCINRPSSASAVVINGKKPGDTDSIATLWVILGEPVTSIAVPVWVEAEASPRALYEGKDAPVCAEALRIKRLLYPFIEGSKKNYMQVTRLKNKEKTGFLQLLLKTEREIFAETARFLKKKRSGNELAVFQDKMAEKALKTLKEIK
ncbi:MAG: hypothetical protein GY950_12695 [bacterium]|nr:hypothetical protein [bacterium]